MPKKARLRFVERTFKCPTCGRKFKFECQLVAHKRTHTGEKPFKCEVCGKMFGQRSTLYTHSKTHSAHKPFACAICMKSFSSKATLLAHENRHSGNREFSCRICDKSFFSSGELKQHELRHEQHSIHTCGRCEKSFGSESGYKRHIASNGIACLSYMQIEGDKPYICTHCGKAYAQHTSLYLHMRTHQVDGQRFACPQCGKMFTTNSNLQVHLLRHSNDRQFACIKCTSSFFTTGELKQHMKRHERRDLYRCARCQHGFGSEAGLNRHLNAQIQCVPADAPTGGSLGNAGVSWKCQFCDKTFMFKSMRTAHERVHTGDKPFKCTICDKRFGHQASLIMHERGHRNDKRYACDTCGKKFLRPSCLYAHRQTHFDERRYACTLCPKKFKQASNLYQHQKRHEKQAEDAANGIGIKTEPGVSTPTLVRRRRSVEDKQSSPIVCFCGRTFEFASHLRAHMRVHTGERPFTCRYCAKTFATVTAQKAHERQQHTGEKPYKCRYCMEHFSLYSQRDAHENIQHLGKSKHSCNVCGKQLSSASSLYAHKGVHSDKNIACPHCPHKYFARNSYLAQHMKNCHQVTVLADGSRVVANVNGTKDTGRTRSSTAPHTPKVHACQYCHRIFKQKAAMVVHERTHTGQRPFQCTQCDKSFASQGNLQQHSRVHSGEKPYKCNLCDKCFGQRSQLNVHLKRHEKKLSMVIGPRQAIALLQNGKSQSAQLNGSQDDSDILNALMADNTQLDNTIKLESIDHNQAFNRAEEANSSLSMMLLKEITQLGKGGRKKTSPSKHDTNQHDDVNEGLSMVRSPIKLELNDSATDNTNKHKGTRLENLITDRLPLMCSSVSPTTSTSILPPQSVPNTHVADPLNGNTLSLPPSAAAGCNGALMNDYTVVIQQHLTNGFMLMANQYSEQQPATNHSQASSLHVNNGMGQVKQEVGGDEHDEGDFDIGVIETGLRAQNECGVE